MLLAFVAVFLVTFLAAPLLGAGWYWDAGNALGYAAGAGLLYLTAFGRGTADLRVHHRLGQYVLVVTLLHAFWFLLGDATVTVHLRSAAPAGLWLGVAGLLLQGALVTGALLPRRWRLSREHPAFRRWHRALALGAIVTAGWHVLDSGFYLPQPYQMLLLAAVAALAGWGRDWQRHWPGHVWPGPRGFPVIVALVVLLFVAVRNWPA
ncbi:MAG: hypothetical protein FJ191_04550 [Gammaproteobacteria bacterium]|nr:hypothetical protein [Gammaproteobacteria bacterium]